jgi:nitrate reductase assembly molybdenum cofactor insertion protein NarJ
MKQPLPPVTAPTANELRLAMRVIERTAQNVHEAAGALAERERKYEFVVEALRRIVANYPGAPAGKYAADTLALCGEPVIAKVPR